jgi:hypothetical protein
MLWLSAVQGHAADLTVMTSADPMRLYRLPVLLTGVALSWAAAAQKPVYRCESAGQVSYSHAPCLGAKEVDVTPTQGLDKNSGKSRKGHDVLRHEQQGQIADALKPLLGMTPEQYRVHHRRSKLSPADRRECQRLDDDMYQRTQRVNRSEKVDRGDAELDLYKTRQRFNALNC